MSNEPSIHASGGSASVGYGRVVQPDRVDTTHGPILYLEEITVSFDGFKALNNLSLPIDIDLANGASMLGWDIVALG
ncbi:MAG: hypothetical protein ACK6C0_14380, partial [Betaproteobacteria bacterium]